MSTRPISGDRISSCQFVEECCHPQLAAKAFDPSILAAGANVVISGEGEVALSMASAMLGRLGALPEQIDRERDRVRADLFGADGASHAGRH